MELGVAGADVRCAAADSAGFSLKKVERVVADALGRFACFGMPDAPATISATHGAQASDEVISPAAETSMIIIRLETQHAISGRVQTDDGAPLGGATVIARRINEVQRAIVRSQVRALTDATGAFEVAPVESGMWALFVIGPDNLVADERSPGKPVAMVPAGTEDVLLAIQRSGGIEGWVELDDGTVPEGVTILVEGFSAPNASGGAFLLQGIPAGTHNLLVTGRDFAPLTVSGVVVHAGETTNVEKVVASRGRALRGTVRDASGRPVGGATVAASRTIRVKGRIDFRRLEEEPELRVAHTDGSGEFEMRGLLPGRMALMAEHPEQGRSPAVALLAEQSFAELRLTTTTTFEGMVTHGGRPLEGAGIIVQSRPTLVKFTALTDADGRYAVGGVPLGHYEIIAAARFSVDTPELLRRAAEAEEASPQTINFHFPLAEVRSGYAQRGTSSAE